LSEVEAARAVATSAGRGGSADPFSPTAVSGLHPKLEPLGHSFRNVVGIVVGRQTEPGGAWPVARCARRGAALYALGARGTVEVAAFSATFGCPPIDRAPALRGTRRADGAKKFAPETARLNSINRS
jgi:hypothetical protein